MKKLFLILLILLFVTISFACDIEELDNNSDKIIVAVGVVPQATFVEKVAGDLVDIVTLIPPGNSPANYQPTAVQMQALSDAIIYFAMQTPTEEANILPKVSDFNKGIEIVYLRDIVGDVYQNRIIDEHIHEEDEQEEDGLEHEEGTVDPHIWLSPKRVIIMVQAIADKLSEIDADNAQIYMDNAQEYIQELNELDEQFKQSIQAISNKTFMIYHGTYGYFADDYGFKMITLENAGKAATPAQMQEVIDYARDENIKTIFYQEEFDDTQANTISKEIDGSVTKVAPLSERYIESLRAFVDELLKQGE